MNTPSRMNICLWCKIQTNLRIQDLAKVKFIIDTGATVNLLEEKDFEALKPEVKLQHSSINCCCAETQKSKRCQNLCGYASCQQGNPARTAYNPDHR